MKRILTGIIAITLVMFCSCAYKTEKVVVSDSLKEGTTTESGAVSDEVVSDGIAEDAMGIVDQSFVGVWSADESKIDQILIWEITEDSVKFNTGVSGLFGFDATGVSLDGEIVFGDGVSPDYSGPDGVKGKLEFSENSITVIYDSFGSIEDSEYYPNKYTFTLKDENSDAIVSQYKATIPN